MSNQRLGKRLAMIREHRHQSQAELAAAIGVTKSAISQYERGRITIKASRLEELARALHCRSADLLAPLNVPLPRASFRGGPPFLGSAAGLWAPTVGTD